MKIGDREGFRDGLAEVVSVEDSELETVGVCVRLSVLVCIWEGGCVGEKLRELVVVLLTLGVSDNDSVCVWRALGIWLMVVDRHALLVIEAAGD